MEDVSGIFMEYSMYSTVCSGPVLFLDKYKQKMNERFYRSVFLFTVVCGVLFILQIGLGR